MNKGIKNTLLFVHCPQHRLGVVQGTGEGPGGVVGVVTCYWMDCPGIES